MRIKGLPILAAVMMAAILFIALPTMACAATPSDPDTVYIDRFGVLSPPMSFNDALALLEDGDDLVLLEDITASNAVIIPAVDVSLKLDNHTFTVNNPTGNALLINASWFHIVGPGTATFNGSIEVASDGTLVCMEDALVDIDGSINSQAVNTDALIVQDGSEVTISGNIIALQLDPGEWDIYAVNCDRSKVEISGNIESAGYGACARHGSEMFISGAVICGVDGLWADEDSGIRLDNDLTAGGSGAAATFGATITIRGDVDAATVPGTEPFQYGVAAAYGGTTNVYGNVVSGDDGVICWDGSAVYIEGDVVAAGQYGVWCETGPYGGILGSEVTIDRGLIVIDPASTFIYVGEVDKTALEHDPTSLKAGYTQWSATQEFQDFDPATSFVWIKTPEPPTPPTPDEPDPVDPVIPPTGDLGTLVSMGLVFVSTTLGMGAMVLRRRSF